MKFDLHIHSKHSADSNSSVKDIINRAAAIGLNGISITDHNSFNGSEEALMLETKGTVIIPGAEYSTDEGHLLVYFLKSGLERLNLKRDILGRFHWRDIIEAAHDQGALVFLAHPFKSNRVHHKELLDLIDGMEVYNSRAALCRNMTANEQALNSVNALQKAFSVGSDAHWLAEIGHAYWEYEALSSNNTGNNSEAIKAALKSGQGRVWGSASQRLYEPSSQILKSFKTKSPMKAIKPCIKFGYCSLLEFWRIVGLGAKAFEGTIKPLNKEGGI